MEWTDMMHYQQQMQKVIRALLPLRKSALTASECELLAHLYLKPEENTPVLLGRAQLPAVHHRDRHGGTAEGLRKHSAALL